MRDMPLDSQEDYTEYIKKYYQDSLSHHVEELADARKEYERINNLSDDELYEIYVKRFSDDRDYYQKRTDVIKEQNAKY